MLILFEDEHLLAINKPAGWNTHAPAPFAGEGVYDWLKHREPRWASLAILHRLDKETSGVLVFGKTPLANKSLTEQFAGRGVRKKYLLLTDRPVPRAEFTAESALVRAGERYVSRPLHPGGERAETRFRLLDSAFRVPHSALVEAEPVTGRTHQIRVHAAEHGFPVLGDVLYGGTTAERVFLHAAELSLRHPATGEAVTFTAPPDWPGSHQRGLRECIDPQATDTFRLIHGASDRQPGWYVDKLGAFLLSQSEAPLLPGQRAELERLAARHGSKGVYHKVLHRNVRGSTVAEASPQLVQGEAAPERFSLRENGLLFVASFNEGYSVGLFLDQRDNRRRFLVNHVAEEFGAWSAGLRPGVLATDSAASAPDRRPALQPELLNVFSYTCGFSVAAAKAGARTTSLDLSKKYLDWGRRNFEINGLDPEQHDFIFGDAFDWMRRLGKKGRAFDAIVLDPPTFSKSKESGAWQAEKDYARLASAALPLLKPGGVLLASTNAARLEPEKFMEALATAAAAAKRKIVRQHYVPQPPDFPISRFEPGYLKTVWMRLS